MDEVEIRYCVSAMGLDGRVEVRVGSAGETLPTHQYRRKPMEHWKPNKRRRHRKRWKPGAEALPER